MVVDALDQVADVLADKGWIVLPEFFPLERVRELRQQAQVEWESGEFHSAGVGRGVELNVNKSVRGDQVHWLERVEQGALADYQAFLEEVRVSLNRSLYLGLFELEAHFAVYPPGAFYRQHLDNFRGTGARIITAILYLNEDWQDADGGQLRLYTDGSEGGDCVEIFPHAGQLVLFRSERFWHEVLPARRERFSLTGWLRTRRDA
jgi:SM-20-related protein